MPIENGMFSLTGALKFKGGTRADLSGSKQK